jgi:hypothetical protein
MAVKLVADPRSVSGRAAYELLERIEQEWPWIHDDPRTDLHIVGGFQGYGKRKDVDIVLLGTFGRHGKIPAPAGLPDRSNRPVPSGRPVRLESLCLAIEVKDQAAGDWRVRGNILEVRYRRDWENASEQSMEQVTSVKEFFERRGLRPPFIVNCLWLRTASRHELQLPPCDNIYPGDLSWKEFVERILWRIRPARRPDGSYVSTAITGGLSSGFSDLGDALTHVIKGTQLDMRQMNRIVGDHLEPKWLEALGKKQLRFRGRAGTGKTVILLQIGCRLAIDRNARALILTFNRILAANLNRMLLLLGADNPAIRENVRVETVDRFLMAGFLAMKLWNKNCADYNKERRRCEKPALAKLREIRKAGGNPRKIFQKDDDRNQWPAEYEYLLVDEGQDVSPGAFQILRQFFPPTVTAVADGIDQRVHSGKRCQWESEIDGCEAEVVELVQCLRMKPNLARFCNVVAAKLGIEWEVKPRDGQDGGRVIIVEGDYFVSRELHDELFDKNREAGNSPLDMLVCLPSTRIEKDKNNKYVRSRDAVTLEKWGQAVWDAAAEERRNAVPQSPEMLRLVPYTSCRGLEAWIGINIFLDEFYARRVELTMTEAEGDAGETGLAPDPETAHRDAAYRVMMPLTRAIDTLVITLSGKRTRLHSALLSAANECADFVERRAI